jgi:hypothetical protein
VGSSLQAGLNRSLPPVAEPKLATRLADERRIAALTARFMRGPLPAHPWTVFIIGHGRPSDHRKTGTGDWSMFTVPIDRDPVAVNPQKRSTAPPAPNPECQ